AGQVGGGNPGADISTSPSHPRVGVKSHGGCPIARDPENSRPQMTDGRSPGCGEETEQQLAEFIGSGLLRYTAIIGARTETVRYTASPEGYPIIRGALCIHIYVREISQDFSVAPIQLVPDV